MIGTLTRRIQMICCDELALLRRQMYTLVWQDIQEGAVEGAATAMARQPSCVNHGVSVGRTGVQILPNQEAGFAMGIATGADPADIRSE